MSTRPQDELNDWPESDRALIAAYRTESTDQPSAELDERVRAAARREVGARPRPMGWNAWRSWGGTPLAVAAVVVLSATVVFMSQRDPVDLALPGPQEAMPPALPDTPAPMAAPAEPQQISSDSDLREDRARLSTPPSPSTERLRPAVKKAERNAQASVPEAAVKAAAPAAGASAVLQSAEVAPKPVAPSSDELDATPRALREDMTGARKALRAPASASFEQSAPEVAGAMPPKDEADRHVWRIERIRSLLQQGHRDEALAELQALRRAAPDYKLPSDLEAFAGEASDSGR